MRRLDILFVSHSSRLYGAERSLLDLLLGLPANMHPLVLIPGPGAMSDVLDQHGIPSMTAPLATWLRPAGRDIAQPAKATFRFARNLRARALVLKKLGSWKPNLIYTNTLYSPLGGLLSLALSAPNLWHFRESIEDMGARFDFGRRLAMNFVDRTTSLVVCNSHSVRSKYRPYLGESKLRVVHNGLLDEAPDNSPHRRMVPGQRVRLAIIGSISPHKRQEDALLALARLVHLGKDVELHVVGDGEKTYIAWLKTLAQELGISNRVRWKGYSSDPLKVYAASDIILVCSEYEAFGRVAVEAMASGCPVVASNAGGTAEIIEHDKNGCLYPVGQHELLADEVAGLICNEQHYQYISGNAVASSYARFGRTRYVADMVDLIERSSSEPSEAIAQ